MQFFIQIRIFFLVHGWVLNPSLRIAMHSQQLDWNKLFVGVWVGVDSLFKDCNTRSNNSVKTKSGKTIFLVLGWLLNGMLRHAYGRPVPYFLTDLCCSSSIAQNTRFPAQRRREAREGYFAQYMSSRSQSRNTNYWPAILVVCILLSTQG